MALISTRDFGSKIQNLAKPARKFFRNPFQENHKPLIIHCAHHKVGTMWFSNVLKGIGNYYGLNFQRDEQQQLKSNTDFFLQNHSRVDFSKLPEYRASHMVRDPRDIAISAYFYHLWTKESWAHIPMGQLSESMKMKWSLLPIEEFSHLTYQEYLNSLDQNNGITTEIKRASGTLFQEMTAWDYENPNCIEIKYEELIKSEEDGFRDIFQHYKFNDEAVKISLSIAEKYSFKNKTGRAVGETSSKSHMRSGQPGEWRNFFLEEHKECFKEFCGEVLLKLGYEENMDW